MRVVIFQQLIREQGVELNSNETQKLKDNKEKKFSWTHYPSYDGKNFQTWLSEIRD